MSKKNNKKIIARKHAHDLQMEKKVQEKLQRQREKTERQKERQAVAAAAAAGPGLLGLPIPQAPVGPVKKVKVKALRLKKGMKVRGIRITNKDSKAQVLDILKAEQAAKMMDLEPPCTAVTTTDQKLKKKKKNRLRLAKDKASKASSSRSSGAAATSAMES